MLTFLTNFTCKSTFAAQDKRTPLHVAAQHGSVHMCAGLCAAGADMDARDAQGRIPLHLAACQGFAHAVQFLLQAGSNARVEDQVHSLI